ncbi:MAG: TraR/DksA C4-type zinc finger protein [Ginsengibacter sp.]
MATQKKKATPVVKKSFLNKPGVKKVAATAKKVSANKSSSKKALAKKPIAKKTDNAKKQSLKSAVSLKKAANPIIKKASAKKSAKSGVKKAAPKKLANTNNKAGSKKSASPVKKQIVTTKKPVDSAKKPVVETKKQIENKSKTFQQKPEKVISQTPVVHMTDHKKELKKALTKTKKEASQKPEKPFVMPKTNTEKARKYEPQFIKSVLDHAPEEDNGPTMRYSDNELTEFKELISRKLETAKKELGYLQGLITRKDEMGGDDTDNRYMTMEDGSLSMEREQLSQMASRQITFIDHLEKAMMRIENKTYGICRVTGKLIDKARLRAVPHATLSIEAKMGIAR